jgi:protein-disulfide isomerase
MYSVSVRRRASLIAVIACLGAMVPVNAAPPSGATTPAAMSQRGPESAPVTILEFSDFECPFCARMPPVLTELLERYPDKVRVVFKHMPLPIHPHSALAHEAAIAAGDQGKFWEMHDLLFANQAHLTPDDLERYAAELQLDAARLRQAIDTREFRPIVARDLAEAAALGANATPTFFVNGRRLVGAQSLAVLERTVEEILNGGRPSATASTVKPESINIEQAEVRGVANAPITIVEFSDFQCPFCARANPFVDEVLAKYGEQVKLVFKHYPLDMHANAPLAHRAALAAGEQGQFWPMHDALFANQAKATRDGVGEMARKLGLDVARFEADLGSGRFDARLQRDRSDGDRLGVDGTPTFFVNGVRIVGAQRPAEFVRVIDKQLAAHRAADPAVVAADASRALGSKDAQVTITWFADLMNPLNADASQLMREIATTYDGAVRVVFKHRPLKDRPESTLAYDAALAAGAQGRFWEMEDILSGSQSAGTIATLVDIARQLGLDAGQFERHLTTRPFATVSSSDREEAERRGVRGTPTFFVDDERIDGVIALETMKDIVAQHLRSGGALKP